MRSQSPMEVESSLESEIHKTFYDFCIIDPQILHLKGKLLQMHMQIYLCPQLSIIHFTIVFIYFSLLGFAVV